MTFELDLKGKELIRWEVEQGSPGGGTAYAEAWRVAMSSVLGETSSRRVELTERGGRRSSWRTWQEADLSEPRVSRLSVEEIMLVTEDQEGTFWNWPSKKG